MRSLNPQELIRILTITAGMFSTNVLAADLCKDDEATIFSCRMASAKIASICRSTNRETLTYRFGRANEIEMTFTDRANKDSSFFYATISSPLLDRFHLGFSRGGYKYTAYRDIYNVEKSITYGVAVDLPNGSRSDLKCRSEIFDEIFSDATEVSCDPDDTLGCNYADRVAAYSGQRSSDKREHDDDESK